MGSATTSSVLPTSSSTTVPRSSTWVGDSIEGWADAVRMLTKAYFGYTSTAPLFDFRDIRAKGASLISSSDVFFSISYWGTCRDVI